MTSKPLDGTRWNIPAYAPLARPSHLLTARSPRLPRFMVWYWFRGISVIFGFLTG
jgi:hypothetical protein